jgi:hypothetical protein
VRTVENRHQFIRQMIQNGWDDVLNSIERLLESGEVGRAANA